MTKGVLPLSKTAAYVEGNANVFRRAQSSLLLNHGRFLRNYSCTGKASLPRSSHITFLGQGAVIPEISPSRSVTYTQAQFHYNTLTGQLENAGQGLFRTRQYGAESI